MPLLKAIQTKAAIQSSGSTGAIMRMGREDAIVEPEKEAESSPLPSKAWHRPSGDGSADFSAPQARRSRRRRTLVLAPGPCRAAYWRVDQRSSGRRSAPRIRTPEAYWDSGRSSAWPPIPGASKSDPDVAAFWDAVGAAAAATRQ